MVSVYFGVSKTKEGEHEERTRHLLIDIETKDEVSVEAVVEELSAVLFRWAESWLRYPDTKITIHVT